jgi:hypothetical protein
MFQSARPIRERKASFIMQITPPNTPETVLDYERLAQKLFSRRIRLDSSSEALGLLRFAVALYDIQKFFKTEEESERNSLLTQLQNLLGRAPHFATKYPEFSDYLLETILDLNFLGSHPATERMAWRGQHLSPYALSIPGMLTHDTMKYYRWLGSTLSGAGEVVEIGCWMGRSTYPLAEGLAANKSFDGHHLHTFDAFTWDQWLDHYADEHRDEFTPDIRANFDALTIGDSYLHLFLGFCAEYKHLIKPRCCFVYHDGKSGEIPEFEWSGEPIELLIQDISSGAKLVQRVWDMLLPSFVSNKTVVVFHQYGLMRAEELRRFCREKADVLLPLHKPHGVAKGFRFTG